jgi:hypothetical protein
MTKGSDTKCSDTKWECVIFLVVILAAAWATFIPSFGEGILLHTQQPYSISDNRTLVAEDVDPSAGAVWLKLYSRNETLKSSLLGVGGHFDYDHTNLSVNKIYAGGEMDLVELGLNRSSSANRSEHLVPSNNSINNSINGSANASANNSANVSSNSSVSAKAPWKSPAFEASVLLTVVLALVVARRVKRMNKS